MEGEREGTGCSWRSKWMVLFDESVVSQNTCKSCNHAYMGGGESIRGRELGFKDHKQDVRTITIR